MTKQKRLIKETKYDNDSILLTVGAALGAVCGFLGGMGFVIMNDFNSILIGAAAPVAFLLIVLASRKTSYIEVEEDKP